MSIELPLRSAGGDEFLEIPLDALPEVDELLDVLRGEQCPIRYWLALAQAYYRQKDNGGFVKILTAATDPGAIGQYEGTNKEIVACLNTLAGYHVQQAEREKDKRAKDEHSQAAIQLYNRSDKIDSYDPTTWLGKGLLMVQQGGANIQRAQYQFNNVINTQSDNIGALLAAGNVAYLSKNYREALAKYRKALQLNAACPAEIRLGMGLCFFKLKMYEKARVAFQRALDINPNCAGAMVGLAVMEINTDAKDGLVKGMRLFKRAYEIEPTNPVVQNHLANHFFYRGELDKAHALSLTAFQNGQADGIKAESSYILGRTFQKQGDFGQAFHYYFQAVRFDPGFAPAQYGLGQMYVLRNDLDQAIQCFEKVLQGDKDNYESLKILGSLYLQRGKLDKAREHMRRVTEHWPNDVDAWVEYGMLLEADDCKAAYAAYSKALDLLTNQIGADVPPELWSNIGALRHQLGDLAGARDAFDKAQAAMAPTGDPDPELKEYYDQLGVTLNYNIARLHESMGNQSAAEAMYKDILKEHPSYIDCYLRLGCMARDKGRIYEASSFYKDALAVNTDHFGTRTLMGNMHLSKGTLQPAEKTFDSILKTSLTTSAMDDVYSLVALGNIFHESAPADKPDKRSEYLMKALRYYEKALKVDPRNIYAANGAGAIMAERGYTNEAREIFVQVREATAEVPDVLVNLAHVYMQQGQYVSAIKMYQTCLRKFRHNHDATILTFLARAHFKMGDYLGAKTVLLKALHCAPNNQEILYNLAIAQERICVQILKNDRATTQQLSGAIREAKRATAIFELLATTKESRSRYSAKSADKEARKSKDLQKQAEHHYAKAQRRETVGQERMAKLEQQRAEWEREKLLEEARKREADERAREEMERAREATVLKQQLASQALKEMEQEKEARRTRRDKDGGDDDKPKRRGKKARAEDDFIDDDGNENDLFGSDAEDAGGSKKRGSRTKGGSGRSSKPRGRRGEQVVSKDIISDSDAELEESASSGSEARAGAGAPSGSQSDDAEPAQRRPARKVLRRGNFLEEDDSDEDDSRDVTETVPHGKRAPVSDDDDDVTEASAQAAKKPRVIASDSEDEESTSAARPTTMADAFRSDDDDE